MMRRIFVDEPIHTGLRVTVSGADGHHLCRVLRIAVGEPFSMAYQGQAFACLAETVDSKRGEVRAVVGEALPSHEPGLALYLLQGLAKGDKIEEIVQKATEVGAKGVSVVATERSVVRLNDAKAAERRQRWQQVAQEAASQSQRDVVPIVHFASDLKTALDWLSVQGARLTLVADEAERSQSVTQAWKSEGSPARLAVAIGPEGGWSDADRQVLMERGARFITLGPRILRTETAGLVAMSALFNENADLGGV